MSSLIEEANRLEKIVRTFGGKQSRTKEHIVAGIWILHTKMSDVFDFELHENNGDGGDYDSDRSDDVRKSFMFLELLCSLSLIVNFILTKMNACENAIAIILMSLNLL